MIYYGLILLGIVLLYYGGEVLVVHAARLARLMGVSTIVIGLTVVAFATSSPELAATLTASLKQADDVSIGTIIGSNISNIGLILGLTAMVYTLHTAVGFIRREVFFMILVAGLMVWQCLDGVVSRTDGALLLVLLAVFIYVIVRYSPKDEINEKELLPEEAQREGTVGGSLLGVAIGVLLLVAGANSLIEGAIYVARSFGIPERVIGITMVALGTSLPELASCVVAAIRKEADIVLGNIIGSNIFNVLCILGIASLVRPIGFAPDSIHIDLGVMLAFSVLLAPLLYSGLKLGKKEGAFLIACYAGYVAWLFLDGSGVPAETAF